MISLEGEKYGREDYNVDIECDLWQKSTGWTGEKRRLSLLGQDLETNVMSQGIWRGSKGITDKPLFWSDLWISSLFCNNYRKRMVELEYYIGWDFFFTPVILFSIMQLIINSANPWLPSIALWIISCML